jgi:hypothetical protein
MIGAMELLTLEALGKFLTKQKKQKQKKEEKQKRKRKQG